MEAQDISPKNRVILSHFDSYSAALVFARWGSTLLLPETLPESARTMAAPAEIEPAQEADTVAHAAIAHYGLNPADVFRENDFDEWMQTDGGPVRIHLLRFNTPDAPVKAIESLGGVFKSISELRGAPMIELALLRQVFNLIVGGSGGR